ncbi:hypothetical protein ACH4TP_07670 [Streptomyces sp. NPDC021012]|uniref:hypothetical protein n=1 Tax=Streptomyces sp. NPDC021012 TaxID=3365107 RepID=UPI0037ADAE95
MSDGDASRPPLLLVKDDSTMGFPEEHPIPPADEGPGDSARPVDPGDGRGERLVRGAEGTRP